MTVNVANGEKLQSKGLVKPVTWKMQGHEFQHQSNTLKLGGYDLVLGVDSLARYSPMEFVLKKLSMKFYKGKQPIELTGESNEVQLKLIRRSRIRKWFRKQAYGIVAQVQVVEEEEKS